MGTRTQVPIKTIIVSFPTEPSEFCHSGGFAFLETHILLRFEIDRSAARRHSEGQFPIVAGKKLRSPASMRQLDAEAGEFFLADFYDLPNPERLTTIAIKAAGFEWIGWVLRLSA